MNLLKGFVLALCVLFLVGVAAYFLWWETDAIPGSSGYKESHPTAQVWGATGSASVWDGDLWVEAYATASDTAYVTVTFKVYIENRQQSKSVTHLVQYGESKLFKAEFSKGRFDSWQWAGPPQVSAEKWGR